MNRVVIRDLADAGAVAETAARDLAQKLENLLKTKQSVKLVLTGGTVGIKTLSQLAPLIENFDLSRLSLWWGDERFVAADSPDRNFVQARGALLSKVRIPEGNIHAMPSTEDGDLLVATGSFAESLGAEEPSFDIVLLGMGGDGHVASLFPGSEPIRFGKWVVAEPNSPKAPSQRISLSNEALSSANEVWFLVAGADKAHTVSMVFREDDLPASKVRGRDLTKWYLDEAAASEITS
jgi:6-phosphogluconolactonase